MEQKGSILLDPWRIDRCDLIFEMNAETTGRVAIAVRVYLTSWNRDTKRR